MEDWKIAKWSEYKSQYLANPTKENESQLQALRAKRNEVIPKLLTNLNKLPEFKDITYKLLGSDLLTSDLDYNISHKSYIVRSKFIQAFDKAFQEERKGAKPVLTSAEVFDVNLYGCAPVDSINPFTKDGYAAKYTHTDGTLLYDFRVYDKPGILDEQYKKQERVAALVKLWQYNPVICGEFLTDMGCDKLKNDLDAAKTIWEKIQANITSLSHTGALLCIEQRHPTSS